MKLYDISMTIEASMAVYKNKEAKKPKFFQSADFSVQGVYETDLTLNLHTGTHIDFPLHTLPGGKTSDSERLEDYLGKAKVLDLSHVDFAIEKSDLVHFNIEKGDFILLKTRNSLQDSFDVEFVYLAHSAALYLAESGIRGVGIDTLGIERNQPNHPTHDTLLSHDIIILEGLRLKEIEPKTYQLLALPLKIRGVEASLCRAVLLENEHN